MSYESESFHSDSNRPLGKEDFNNDEEVYGEPNNNQVKEGNVEKEPEQRETTDMIMNESKIYFFKTIPKIAGVSNFVSQRVETEIMGSKKFLRIVERRNQIFCFHLIFRNCWCRYFISSPCGLSVWSSPRWSIFILLRNGDTHCFQHSE